MCGVWKFAGLHFTDVGPYGIESPGPQVAELFQKFRFEAGIQPQHVGADKHLAAASGTRTNTDGRDAQRFGDSAGDVFRDQFQHDSESTRIFRRARGVQQLLFISLNPAHAAQLPHGLRSHSDMSHHGNLGSANGSNRFGLNCATFQFDGIRPGFLDDPAGISNRLHGGVLRSAVECGDSLVSYSAQRG